MFKGFIGILVALISTAQVDQYLTHGGYTEAAMAMLRQIKHASVF
jgi:hypothetical protein